MTKRQLLFPCEVIKKPSSGKFHEQITALFQELKKTPEESHKIFSVKGKSQFDRMSFSLKTKGYECRYHDSLDFHWENLKKDKDYNLIHFFPGKLKQSFLLSSQNLAVFSMEHFHGTSFQRTKRNHSTERNRHLSFGELKENDYVLHAVHGICQFKGLRKMPVADIEAEFLQLEFRDKDKLFLPIYRIHQINKYSSERTRPNLDKLGSSRFANIKNKDQKTSAEMAHDLIKLYARRSEITRPVHLSDKTDISDFFNAFPYQETEDQIKAIEDVVTDLTVNEKPMESSDLRDVGFGKTEVAMRASFIVAAGGKQVALLAPTTVLTMQHYRTLKKRFKDWPTKINVVNRLQTPAQIKKPFLNWSQGMWTFS